MWIEECMHEACRERADKCKSCQHLYNIARINMKSFSIECNHENHKERRAIRERLPTGADVIVQGEDGLWLGNVLLLFTLVGVDVSDDRER